MNANPKIASLAAALAMVLAVAATPALAGEVYGKITLAGAPVGAAATVAAKCGDKAYAAKPTDASGSYHLIVAETGKCTLTVAWKGKSASLEIVSYDEGAQVDIALEMKDGALTARRR